MPSDEALMADYKGGDAAALRELFRRHAGALLRMFQRDLPRAEAEDLVQQTFLQLHRARADYRDGAALRPWLFTIAMNLKRMHFRTRGRRPSADVAVEPSAEPPGRPEDFDAPMRAERLRDALARLPETQRDAIVLHWLEGLPFAEVARVLGSTEAAVKVRAHRGYGKLRQLLADVTGDGDPAYREGRRD